MKGHHNHDDCIETALLQAETLCAERGARLTDLRRQVLELVWRRHEPVGAYDLLEDLKTKQGRAAPPTVYRALDFLMEQGLVHRIETLNAYIGCSHPDRAHSGVFLLCRRCGTIGELDDAEIGDFLHARADARGFRAESQTVEIRGLCGDCAAPPAQ